MKYCTNCGQKLPDFANFCPMCGQKQFPMVEEETQEVEEVVIEEQPVVEETPIEEQAIVATPIIEETPVEVKEEAQEEIAIESPKPAEEPVTEEIQETVETQENPAEKPQNEENQQEEVKEVAVPEENKKNNPVVKFVEDTKPLKLLVDDIRISIIIFGVIFGLSMLFYIISAFTNIFILFEFVHWALSGILLVRAIIVVVYEIIKNKVSNMFNLLLKGTFVIGHFVLFILNFILMVI